ncbi:MAG: hypothetical protein IKP66_07580 [Lachnospiraceae bacterium]|nr:hypothetical protein [Lachnospiraceae bacterium]
MKYGAGDDCVRFGMTVYNYITEGGLFDLHTEILNGSQMPTNEKKGSYLNYGKTILLRDANRFVDSNYELDEWFDNIGYYRIDVDENFDIEDLRPGDFLCCDGGSKSGHVEFYLGYNYVEQVNLETNEVSYERGTAIDRINNSASSGGKAESTYGWGLVSNKIPSYERYGGNEYNWYFYKSADDTSIYRCKGYHECLRKVEGTNKYKFRNVNDNTEFESQCCCTDKRAYNVIYRQNGY